MVLNKEKLGMINRPGGEKEDNFCIPVLVDRKLDRTFPVCVCVALESGWQSYVCTD
jgi:hypothetical protein